MDFSTMNRVEDVVMRERKGSQSEFCVLQKSGNTKSENMKTGNIKCGNMESENENEGEFVPLLLRCSGNEDSSLDQESSEERPLDSCDVDSQNPTPFSPPGCSNGYNSEAVRPSRRLSKGRRLEPYCLEPEPRTPTTDKIGVTMSHFTTVGEGELSPAVRAVDQENSTSMVCQTPAGREYRIPPVLVCPGAPRKRQVARRLRMSETVRNLLRPLDFESCLTVEPIRVR